MISKSRELTIWIQFQVLQQWLVICDSFSMKCLLNFLKVLIRNPGQLLDIFRLPLYMPKLAIWPIITEPKLIVETFTFLELNWRLKMIWCLSIVGLITISLIYLVLRWCIVYRCAFMLVFFACTFVVCHRLIKQRQLLLLLLPTCCILAFIRIHPLLFWWLFITIVLINVFSWVKCLQLSHKKLLRLFIILRLFYRWHIDWKLLWLRMSCLPESCLLTRLRDRTVFDLHLSLSLRRHVQLRNWVWLLLE